MRENTFWCRAEIAKIFDLCSHLLNPFQFLTSNWFLIVLFIFPALPSSREAETRSQKVPARRSRHRLGHLAAAAAAAASSSGNDSFNFYVRRLSVWQGSILATFELGDLQLASTISLNIVYFGRKRSLTLKNKHLCCFAKVESLLSSPLPFVLLLWCLILKSKPHMNKFQKWLYCFWISFWWELGLLLGRFRCLPQFGWNV